MAGAPIHLPVLGDVSRRSLAIGGVAAAGVTGYLYWRKRSAAAAAPTDGTDPTDPTDASAYGDGTYGTDLGDYGTAAGPYVPPTADGPLSGGGFTTNPQWTAAAQQALAGIVDAAQLSSALGKFLTGAQVNSSEESLIDQAIAVAGEPPVAGPTGYPPAIRQAPATGQSTSTRLPAPHAPSVSSISTSSVVLKVASVPGAEMYAWYVNGSGEGFTQGPAKQITGLKPKTGYSFTAAAHAGTTTGPQSPAAHATTK